MRAFTSVSGMPRAELEDQVRPDLALCEHGEVGLPMLQEAGARSGARRAARTGALALSRSAAILAEVAVP